MSVKEPLGAREQPARDGRGVSATARRGADDQAAAYEALLARWADADPQQDERGWQRVRQQLQETRCLLGQGLLFPE
jgi:uncharacterized tellurite resistance protein B-like protein